MADCDCLPGCPFFNDKMANMPMTAEVIKRRLCRGDNSQCARHKVKVALGMENVPPNLYPNQIGVADEVIAKAKATGTK